RPHVLRIYMRRLADPLFFSREPVRVAEELWFLAQSAPRDLRLILKRIREGRANLGVELHGLEASVKKYALATNRLSLSVVMGAIILGSCYLLVHSSGDLARWLGTFPLQAILGLVGIAIACFYGFVLFIGF